MALWGSSEWELQEGSCLVWGQFSVSRYQAAIVQSCMIKDSVPSLGG
jgi:hypothetical protein